ncbi:MAG: enoyl-CoA hydratase/isomerase family protein [Bacillaceae bacterium]|nr:enoyl-CoA hydratase/isomerase family protein [Bacillaceae bacterium]
MYETIKYEVEQGICRIILNRPDVLNSFNAKMNKEVTDAFKQAGKDPDVRVIVLTGEGRAFSAGEDLANVQGDDFSYGDTLRKRYNPMIKQIASTEKPVIAAINGVAAGAGASAALACDFRIATRKASIIMAFVNIGLVPDSGAMYYLPRLVGMSKAIEMAYLGDKVTADEAHRIGLVNAVADEDHFEEEVNRLATRLAHSATKAIGLIKRALYHNMEVGLEDALEYEAYCQEIAGNTEDHKEGVDAFFNKRKPEFKGR